MNLQIIIILKICFLFSLSVSAYEIDVAFNGQLKTGNTELVEYGGRTSFENTTLELHALSELYKNSQAAYWKHQGSASYLYDLPGKGWDGFAWAQVTRDDKKGINLATKEAIGGIYRFSEYLSYSLGIGHRRLNLKDDPILSHRLKIKYGGKQLGAGLTTWVWNGLGFREYLCELELSIKPFNTLRFGFLASYEYNSLPLFGRLKEDLTTKLEIALNWNTD